MKVLLTNEVQQALSLLGEILMTNNHLSVIVGRGNDQVDKEEVFECLDNIEARVHEISALLRQRQRKDDPPNAELQV